ncbi:splicing factor 3b subunit 4 [Histoplasma capsulatum H143]|uniref:Splicing factor 3b subunit 4 n=1 Tax=Ajellomyces capsulatus (strain H143) TaxID=544712 RepID=C6HGQ3_AJECH|nr:splicing factor 3b subunit 4 [Histoplasma capsulatum H143]
MAGVRHWEQDKEATVYIGNLDERITDSLVWELMLQAGRIVNVHLPKDRVTQTHQGYGFVEFISEEDAEYAARIMNQVRLYGKPIRVNKASADKQKMVEVGAELFVGNLDPMVTEQVLYDTFSRFGSLISAPKIARDDANLSKGYGFVSFSNFEASDDAIANMNGQYLMNKEVSVQYAYKKDGLPARPPPSQAGYGGPPPQGFVPPPRFGQQPPPASFGPTPSAAGPPGATPPPLPLGFQQPGYGRGR